MKKKNEAQWIAETHEMHSDFLEICQGHSHDQVLTAIGTLLVDALDPAFFHDDMSGASVDKRIDFLMGVLKEIVTRLVKEDWRQ